MILLLYRIVLYRYCYFIRSYNNDTGIIPDHIITVLLFYRVVHRIINDTSNILCISTLYTMNDIEIIKDCIMIKQ